MQDLWFTYPGAKSAALRGVDLSIERGHVVALVGANGSGKTTVAKLVCGLYEPDRGQIAWAAGATPRVGVIFQDFMRYELTARDNITLGDTARIADDEHMAASAKAASADDFLAALPRGYDTWLSPSFEGGTDLSVGQWQRVAMARALFREAPVLVLDEPTAALDPSAERDLIAATKRLFADKAVLVISHRFANVVDADRIHVLDEGRVIESGSHDELVALGGRYAEMYRLQASMFGFDTHD
jgi:ATP-binding cassette subfamily B protein